MSFVIMSQISKVQIKPSCILGIPLQVYANDFSFIVNGQEFKTSQLISDLLSPIICRIHANDPTFNVFEVNTKTPGNFSNILNLFNFKINNIPESELPFLLEVIEILGNDSIEYEESESIELTIDNVFKQIRQHEIHSKFNHNRFLKEIEFISSHFFELCDSHEEEFLNISVFTLFEILSCESLELESEDQLLKFADSLYKRDDKYSILYEAVFFENVSALAMKEFLSLFDSDDMTAATWDRLKKRLEKESLSESKEIEKRYKNATPKGIEFKVNSEEELNGIIKHLRSEANGNIENKVSITASSVFNDYENYQPRNVALFEDQKKRFESKDQKDGWICFDFKDHQVIPTDYAIRSYPCAPNIHHPRSWVVEGSSDNSSYETLDKQYDCSYLNGQNIVHTFKMNQPNGKEYRYIRMRLTGPDWANCNYLKIDSFEIYGRLI